MVTIRPIAEPARELDVTECLIRAIEAEIAARYGGNAVLNRLEAEGHVARLLRESNLASESPTKSTMPRGRSPRASNISEEILP